MLHKYVLCFLMLFVIKEVSCVGNRITLSGDEKHSSTIRRAASFATNEIHYKKLQQGEYDKCTRLENEIISGEKQVIGIIKVIYSLQLKIKPVAVKSERCLGKKPQDDWKPELCETEIICQAWNEPQMELKRAVCLKIED